MQKGLCITALSISALVLLAFLFDILLGFAGMKALAPYKSFSLIGDLVFMACAGVIGFLSWKVFRSLP